MNVSATVEKEQNEPSAAYELDLPHLYTHHLNLYLRPLKTVSHAAVTIESCFWGTYFLCTGICYFLARKTLTASWRR